MNFDWRLYISVALVFMLMWGGCGLVSGDGFFGGIEKQFEAIGNIVVYIIKTLVFWGVLCLIFDLVTRPKRKPKE